MPDPSLNEEEQRNLSAAIRAAAFDLVGVSRRVIVRAAKESDPDAFQSSQICALAAAAADPSILSALNSAAQALRE